MHRLEFYFDCSSPWTYLAFERIQPIAAMDDVNLIWKPILVGGIFNSINPSVYENRAKPVPAKIYQKCRYICNCGYCYPAQIYTEGNMNHTFNFVVFI